MAVESRRSPRFQLPPGVAGELNGRLEATVVDLSAHGARLEHCRPLRPAHQYVLTLPVRAARNPVTLFARVVWSQVHRFEAGRGVIYHSGVEFRDVAAEAAQGLGVCLALAQAGGAGLCATAPAAEGPSRASPAVRSPR